MSNGKITTENSFDYVDPEKRRAPELGVAPGSPSGFWRSARGENHGRDSRPGDVWVEPGDITDTDRINFLVEHTHYEFWVHHPDYHRTGGKLFKSEGCVIRAVIGSAIKWHLANE